MITHVSKPTDDYYITLYDARVKSTTIYELEGEVRRIQEEKRQNSIRFRLQHALELFAEGFTAGSVPH